MTRSPHQLVTLAVSELSTDDVVARIGAGPTPRVSVYLPTHVAGRDVTQDPVRFRRLIGLATTEAEHDGLFDRASALVDDRDFWAHGSEGLGVLIDAEQTTAIRLPEPVRELAVVSDRFHLKPLLPHVDRGLAIDILAISRHAVRLVRADADRAVEIDVPGLPAGMADALRWDDRERQLQSHAAGRTGSGRVTAEFHGHDGGDRQRDVARFLHLVDQVVAGHRANSNDPLVLAGVDELIAAYRDVSRCRHVADAHVSGNPDHLTARQLADRARPLVPPSRSDEERARETFLRRTSATVDTVEQAVIAAAAGQVTSLFVPIDREFWGRHQPGHALIVEHDEREPGDHDLADVAAAETLRHGGLVFVVPSSEIPGGGTAAATLRY